MAVLCSERAAAEDLLVKVFEEREEVQELDERDRAVSVLQGQIARAPHIPKHVKAVKHGQYGRKEKRHVGGNKVRGDGDGTMEHA